MIVLSLAAAEMAMRYLDRPRDIVSGWRATDPAGPVNEFGFRAVRQKGSHVTLTNGVVYVTVPRKRSASDCWTSS